MGQYLHNVLLVTSNAGNHPGLFHVFGILSSKGFRKHHV